MEPELDISASILTALNMPEGDGAAVPVELQLMPPGPLITGRDGRRWVMESAQAVVDATLAMGLDIPIDINHSTQKRGSSGHPSPAVGWIATASLSVRNGSIYGLAEWTAEGHQRVSAREYRYLSPAFLYVAQDLRVQALSSVSLVNSPNLQLDALNNQKEITPMTPELLTALNLTGTPTDTDVLTVVTALNAKVSEQAATLTALNTQVTEQADTATALNAKVAEQAAALTIAENATPAADQYVPMAQYQAVMDRATTAETSLNEQRQAAQETAINSAVDTAIEAGKIAPATREFYVASCQQDGGLDRFNAFIETAPKVIADDSGLDQKTAENSTALNDSDTVVANALGIEPEAFAQSKGAVKTA